MYALPHVDMSDTEDVYCKTTLRLRMIYDQKCKEIRELLSTNEQVTRPKRMAPALALAVFSSIMALYSTYERYSIGQDKDQMSKQEMKISTKVSQLVHKI